MHFVYDNAHLHKLLSAEALPPTPFGGSGPLYDPEAAFLELIQHPTGGGKPQYCRMAGA